jgi:hypothetical protein
MLESNGGTSDQAPGVHSALEEPLTARQRRAVAQFVGLFGGLLIAWLLAELTVRDTPYADVLHIAIALAGGVVGFLLARWRTPIGGEEA